MSLQVPPLTQGLDSHSLLLMSQFVPLHPGAQSHLYLQRGLGCSLGSEPSAKLQFQSEDKDTSSTGLEVPTLPKTVQGFQTATMQP